MKVAIFYNDVTSSTHELEHRINDFIKYEEVIDIKYLIHTDQSQQDWMYAIVHYKGPDDV